MEILTYDGLRMRVGPTDEREFERIIGEGGRRGEIYTKLRQLSDRCADEVRRRYPKIPRRVSSYNLDELLPERGFNVARALVGSESTCVLILRATTEPMRSPPYRALLLVAYPDIFACGDNVAAIRDIAVARPVEPGEVRGRPIAETRNAAISARDIPRVV